MFPHPPAITDEDPFVFLLSVDGTDCPILEPRPFSRSWFSHKFKGAAIKYEIALDLEGNIVWVSPPYRGSINDKVIFRQGLQDMIPHKYLAIVDKGYNMTDKLAPINAFDDREVILFKKRILARHETVNKRIKDFAITSTKFRHDIPFHDVCFDAVATICQYNIENGDPLFAI